jgi:hypothetical protein
MMMIIHLGFNRGLAHCPVSRAASCWVLREEMVGETTFLLGEERLITPSYDRDPGDLTGAYHRW